MRIPRPLVNDINARMPPYQGRRYRCYNRNCPFGKWFPLVDMDSFTHPRYCNQCRNTEEAMRDEMRRRLIRVPNLRR